MKRKFIIGIGVLVLALCGILLIQAFPRKGIMSEASPSVNQTHPAIERAVREAIIGREASYFRGEAATEGHIILDIQEKNGETKVYLMASYGAFGFENGVFTKISGSGAIPTVITLAKSEQGEYSLREYQEPLDGAGYSGSLKKMFPRRLHNRVLKNNDNDYSVLVQQQEEQAAVYLQSIGRDAPVRARHGERKLAQINVEASNKLFAQFTKYNPFLNACPYWLGTREQLEEGVRYIYETAQSKTEDGYELITFTKIKEDGTIVEEAKYKIVGSEPLLIP